MDVLNLRNTAGHNRMGFVGSLPALPKRPCIGEEMRAGTYLEPTRILGSYGSMDDWIHGSLFITITT